MNIKLKRDKTPLKRFITLEKYKNNKILNADKNVKKTKPNFLQDNKFSIETLTYSSSSFNQKSNIFQESDLLVSQKSIKQNNNSSFNSDNIRIKEYFRNIELNNKIIFGDRYEKLKLFFLEDKKRNIHLDIGDNKKNMHDFNKKIKFHDNQSTNKSQIGNKNSVKENKINAIQDNNKRNEIKKIKVDGIKKNIRIDNNNRGYIQNNRKKARKNEDIKKKNNENNNNSKQNIIVENVNNIMIANTKEKDKKIVHIINKNLKQKNKNEGYNNNNLEKNLNKTEKPYNNKNSEKEKNQIEEEFVKDVKLEKSIKKAVNKNVVQNKKGQNNTEELKKPYNNKENNENPESSTQNTMSKTTFHNIIPKIMPSTTFPKIITPTKISKTLSLTTVQKTIPKTIILQQNQGLLFQILFLMLLNQHH